MGYILLQSFFREHHDNSFLPSNLKCKIIRHPGSEITQKSDVYAYIIWRETAMLLWREYFSSNSKFWRDEEGRMQHFLQLLFQLNISITTFFFSFFFSFICSASHLNCKQFDRKGRKKIPIKRNVTIWGFQSKGKGKKSDINTDNRFNNSEVDHQLSHEFKSSYWKSGENRHFSHFASLYTGTLHSTREARSYRSSLGQGSP